MSHGGRVPLRSDEDDELGPSDQIVLAYAVALAGVAVFGRVHSPALLLALAAVASSVIAIARFASASSAARVVHDFAPIGFVIALFSLTGSVIEAANPVSWDAQLAALDRAWFGGLPAAWIGLWGRPDWLVELASILYATYYAIPLAIAVSLYRGDRRADFESFVFACVATFLASYVGYLLAPAYGPRLPTTQEVALGGHAVSAWLRSFLHFAEGNQLDAFPSGHTALSIVYLVLGWRLLPRWRFPLLVLTAGIVFATVYLSLHYVVDIAAGALLAGAMLLAAPALHRVLAGQPGRAVRDLG
jgi:membrane-associated phospholipid phosphatase